jgi:2-octaprenyl-3-methyl-6-methoxy-1,4-benzoquinol hydroxylase
MLMEFDQLQATIEANFPKRLGGIKSIQARASFPLRRLHAQRYVDEGVALLGDAAHQINPLAGQGVNLGFQDVAAFSQVIHDALSRNESISSVEVLKRYEQKRRKGNLLMMQAMDLFYRLFSNQKKPLKLVRNLMLGLGGAAKPARVKALRIASGIDRF